MKAFIRSLQTTLVLLACLIPGAAIAQNGFYPDFTRSKIFLQSGGFWMSPGETQNIGIVSLIGDKYTVTSDNQSNILLGVGYYVQGYEQAWLSLMYGLNAFYFGYTTISGNIIQEGIFTNLSYRYRLANYPLYFATKAFITTNSDKYTVTVDLGIGPSVSNTSQFSESSLDGGITIPGNDFAGRTSVVFSAMFGFGISLNQFICQSPLEIGYRLFYFGSTNLKTLNSQITNPLKTGNNFANAIVVNFSI